MKGYKILSEGKDYKIKEKKDYKSLSKGEGESYLLSGVGTWELEP